MVDLYEKYGLKKEEVLQWGASRYPQFIKAESILAQLYIKEVQNKTIEPAEVALMTGTDFAVDELSPNVWGVITVVVGIKTKSNSYNGCPTCMKKVPDDNICSKCGPTTAVELTFETYVAGDNSGDLMLSVGPRLVAEFPNLEGLVIRARGSIGDQGEFNVNNLELLSEPASGLAEKQTVDMVEREVGLLTNVIQSFGSVAYEDLKQWHATKTISCDLDMLMVKAGAVKAEDGKVSIPDVDEADAEVPAE